MAKRVGQLLEEDMAATFYYPNVYCANFYCTSCTWRVRYRSVFESKSEGSEVEATDMPEYWNRGSAAFDASKSGCSPRECK